MSFLAKRTNYEPLFVRRRYNRIARFFVFFEWLFLLPRKIRTRAVSRLELKPCANYSSTRLRKRPFLRQNFVSRLMLDSGDL
jgi:hypothetical protein